MKNASFNGANNDTAGTSQLHFRFIHEKSRQVTVSDTKISSSLRKSRKNLIFFNATSISDSHWNGHYWWQIIVSFSFWMGYNRKKKPSIHIFSAIIAMVKCGIVSSEVSVISQLAKLWSQSLLNHVLTLTNTFHTHLIYYISISPVCPHMKLCFSIHDTHRALGSDPYNSSSLIHT